MQTVETLQTVQTLETVQTLPMAQMSGGIRSGMREESSRRLQPLWFDDSGLSIPLSHPADQFSLFGSICCTISSPPHLLLFLPPPSISSNNQNARSINRFVEPT